MTTMIVELQNSGDARKIAVAVRQFKGVARVKVQAKTELKRIPGALPLAPICNRRVHQLLSAPIANRREQQNYLTYSK